jgi:hypothetical protein
MKHHFKTLAVATTLLLLPLFAQSQTSPPDAQAPVAGHREAVRMVPARAVLLRTLDAKDDHAGSTFQAKLVQKVTLTNGTVLPNDTILDAEVTVDDLQQKGKSTLAILFNQAHLKNGSVVPIKATIVGFYVPRGGGWHDYPVRPGDQVPNSWNDGSLQFDQIGVVGDVDLHSKISSANSGVFVSTKKDNIKLDEGSEIQFAIGPGLATP